MDISEVVRVAADALSDTPFAEPRGEAVFVSGSLLEGLGNSGSDIDVYVVLEDGRPPDTRLHTTQRAGRRVDFHVLSLNEVEGLAMESNHPDPDSFPFVDIHVELSHRIRIGRGVRRTARFDDLRARFDFQRLAQRLYHRHLTMLDCGLEDLWGMVDGGDLDVASLLAKNLTLHSVAAYLFSRGGTNTKQKWIPKLLSRLPESPGVQRMQRDFWALQFPSEPSRARAWQVAYVDECARFSQRVTELCES